jgi:hypothetical protein
MGVGEDKLTDYGRFHTCHLVPNDFILSQDQILKLILTVIVIIINNNIDNKISAQHKLS